MLAALVFGAAWPARAESVSWSVQYDANTLPTNDGWSLENPSGYSDVASTSSGILSLDLRSEDGVYYWWKSWTYNGSWTSEVRVQETTASSASSRIPSSIVAKVRHGSSNTIRITVDFYTDATVFSTGTGQAYSVTMDNSTQLRTYRLCFDSSRRVFEAYAQALGAGDWTIVFQGSVGIQGDDVRRFQFGRAWQCSGCNGGDSNWDYVYYTSGYYPPQGTYTVPSLGGWWRLGAALVLGASGLLVVCTRSPTPPRA